MIQPNKIWSVLRAHRIMFCFTLVIALYCSVSSNIWYKSYSFIQSKPSKQNNIRLSQDRNRRILTMSSRLTLDYSVLYPVKVVL